MWQVVKSFVIIKTVITNLQMQLYVNIGRYVKVSYMQQNILLKCINDV